MWAGHGLGGPLGPRVRRAGPAFLAGLTTPGRSPLRENGGGRAAVRGRPGGRAAANVARRWRRAGRPGGGLDRSQIAEQISAQIGFGRHRGVGGSAGSFQEIARDWVRSARESRRGRWGNRVDRRRRFLALWVRSAPDCGGDQGRIGFGRHMSPGAIGFARHSGMGPTLPEDRDDDESRDAGEPEEIIAIRGRTVLGIG